MHYSLDNLVAEFKKHISEWEGMIDKWNEENPTTPRDKDAFSLCHALHAIVTEIKTLKDKYDASQPQVPPNVPSEEGQNPQGSI